MFLGTERQMLQAAQQSLVVICHSWRAMV